MYLLAVDDFIFSEKGIDPALITDRSSNLARGVDRRAGRYSSVFFGTSAQPGSWHVIIQVPDEATSDALMAVLATIGDDEVRLLAQRGDDDPALVTINAAVSNVQPHGSAWNLEVTFESNDTIWTGLDVETVTKTFTSALDQVIHLPAPGNVPTQPVLRLLPTQQRAVSTPAVGWSKRVRVAVINGSDEPWFRYPVRLPLGDTSALIAAGKAQASGADLRVWLHGLEQSRTLVDWNGPASYAWVIVPALPPGEALTYEIVYGNPEALASDGVDLVYPELPAFDVSASDNYAQLYRSERDLANAAMGLWPLSSAYEGGSADYGVPGAWHPALTWENPTNDDSYVQPSAQRLQDGGDSWYQALLFASRWRGPGFTDIEAYQGSDPYDGVVLSNPMGIRAVESDGIRWRNDAALKTVVTTTVGSVSETSEVLVPHDPYTRVVVIGRDSGGDPWHVLTEYGQPQGGGETSRLYLPSSGASPISPAFASDWDDTAGADRVAMVASKSETVMASKSVAFAFAPSVSGHFTFDATFGSLGTGNTNFDSPQQVAHDPSGNLYVADFANDRVKKHDASGTFVSNIITGLDEVTGVCVDPSGNLYVSYKAGSLDYRVRKYNSAGVLQWTGSLHVAGAFQHLATDGTRLYAANGAVDIIYVYLCADGSFSSYFGGNGTANGEFNDPVGIATDGAYVYVADSGNNRIQKFTTSGTFVAAWSGTGSSAGPLLTPAGIAVHPVTGLIYVADAGNDRIVAFTPAGVYQADFDPGAGSSAGQLGDPKGLAFSPDGTVLYVTEVDNDRVTLIDIAWAYDGSTLLLGDATYPSATGLDLLLRQYVYELEAGVSFSTADTVKGQLRAATESDTDARAQLVIRVVTADGTVRATLLGVDGAAMDNAFAASLTNRTFPRDAPVNLEATYTTVAGDYLVLEYGARFGSHTVNRPSATLRFGDAATDDLAEDETATTDDAPWIEFSTDLFPVVGEIHTEVAAWRPPSPVKHFGIACWPKGGVSIPDNAESRVLVESDGDITVHIAAEPLVITRIEDEVEIYELATELRLHGGGNAVGPYDTLLVGNARGLRGPGTPRAAVVLDAQGLQIDTERHTHTLWDTTFTTQDETLPAHAVRALAGSLRDIDAADIPALERLPATVPNATFASDLTGWEQHQTDVDWSYTVTHDPAVGGEDLGSLRFTLATTDAATVLWRSTTYLALAAGDAVEVTCWTRQTDAGATAPRLGVAWYDAGPALLGVSLNAADEIPLNPAIDHELSFAATPPDGATQCRVVLGVTAVADAPGSKWFDDVAAAIIRPLRYDGSVAKVTEEARSSRWLPLAPPRRTVPNGTFDDDITGWALEDGGSGITQAASHDAAVGGEALGSLKVAITANSGSDQVIYRTTGFFAVNGADRVELSAWMTSDDAAIWPLLGVLWYGDTGSTALASTIEPRWDDPPVPGDEYVRSFAAIVPPGMTRFRLALVADATASATGTVWFDDVRLNDNDLLVADASAGELDVTALVQPRWTP